MRYLISAVAAVLIVAMVAGTVATLGPVSAGKSDLADMVTPKYDDKGQLRLPTDFRKWVFVGSSLGLSYFGEEKEIGEQIFHHIYMQPQAYDTYVETGKFPEKTMLVMENYSAGTKDNNTAKGVVEGRETFGTMHGQFEDIRLGLEVAL
ncbi:MAG: cytochrome P460 family protein, partial [Candidatus Hydrogenedentota bacterium]